MKSYSPYAGFKYKVMNKEVWSLPSWSLLGKGALTDRHNHSYYCWLPTGQSAVKCK